MALVYVESMETIKKISEYLSYSPDTGVITWIKSPSRAVKVGQAVRKTGLRYSRIQLFKKSYMAHRIAWLLTTGKWPESQIDHINGDRNDNRLINLRSANSYENARNKVCHRSGKKWGSHQIRGKWHAQFRHDGKTVFVGIYSSEDAAHGACLGYIKAMGWESDLNFKREAQ